MVYFAADQDAALSAALADRGLLAGPRAGVYVSASTGERWVAGHVQGRPFFLLLEAASPFEQERELAVIFALARRGIDPSQAALERAGRTAVLTERFFRQRRPALRLRRLSRALLMPGWGRFPMRYLRAVDYLGLSNYLSRSWDIPFDRMFLELWRSAERSGSLQPVDELIEELLACGLPDRRAAVIAATRDW